MHRSYALPALLVLISLVTLAAYRPTSAEAPAPPPAIVATANIPVERPVPAPPAQSKSVPPAATARPTAAAPSAQPAAAPVPAGPDAPARLSIPSIGLDDRIVKVGVTKSGDMDVPDGATSNVGWYAAGTVPGETGSAVIAAHVFAAFKKLDQVRAGSDVYVTMQSGETLRFKVTSAQTYALAGMSADALFNDHSGKYLRLITCAGDLTPDGSTYDHRTVVYATLAQ